MATTVDGSTGVSQIQDDKVTVDKLNLISTGSVPSLEAKGTSGVTSGYLKLNCSENSHGIKLLGPPHSAAANYTLTFPNNDGDASQFLQTNGSGVMSWAAAGGGFTTLGTVNGSVGTTLRFSGINCSAHKFLVFSVSALTAASAANPIFKLGSLNATTGDFIPGDSNATSTFEGMIWLDTSNNTGMISNSL